MQQIADWLEKLGIRVRRALCREAMRRRVSYLALGVVLVAGTSNAQNRIGQLFKGAMARVGLVVTDSSFFDDVPCPRSQPAKTQMSSHRRPTVCGIRNN